MIKLGENKMLGAPKGCYHEDFTEIQKLAIKKLKENIGKLKWPSDPKDAIMKN